MGRCGMKHRSLFYIKISNIFVDKKANIHTNTVRTVVLRCFVRVKLGLAR